MHTVKKQTARYRVSLVVERIDDDRTTEEDRFSLTTYESLGLARVAALSLKPFARNMTVQRAVDAYEETLADEWWFAMIIGDPHPHQLTKAGIDLVTDRNDFDGGYTALVTVSKSVSDTVYSKGVWEYDGGDWRVTIEMN